jgi:hypothetical protein
VVVSKIDPITAPIILVHATCRDRHPRRTGEHGDNTRTERRGAVERLTQNQIRVCSLSPRLREIETAPLALQTTSLHTTDYSRLQAQSTQSSAFIEPYVRTTRVRCKPAPSIHQGVLVHRHKGKDLVSPMAHNLLHPSGAEACGPVERG